MTKITHEIIAYVDTGAWSAKPALDIHQGDQNTHILLIKLRNSIDDKPVSISDGGRARITIYDADEKIITSSAVDIVNPYRGVLSYTLGPAVVDKFGRKTIYLDVSECNCSCDCGPSISFTLIVSKVAGYNNEDPSTIETTITVEDYDKIMGHIDDHEIHLNHDDREFLNKFNHRSDELENALEGYANLDEEIAESVVSLSGQVLRRAMITVDTKTEMLAFPEEDLCDGKLFRVNYPHHDDSQQTIDSNEDGHPEYWVARWHGSPDSGHYEFHLAKGFYGSGGSVPEDIEERLLEVEGKIGDIEDVIPDAATAQNQLADKNFVNSSVATNTANFIGTFNSVADLEAYSGTVTNNDYAFVVEYDPQDPTQVVAYNRYKYNGDTQEWLFEYALNNSSFTTEQWAAINSAITADLVTAYSAHIADSTIHVTANDKTNWNNKISSSEKGVAGGVPTLGDDGKIPKTQLPPTVPDGGTSGQVLTKQSNTDGDADWENIPTVAPITGTLTLLANSWVEDQTGSGVYKQSITIPSSNTNSKVDIVPSSEVIDQMLADGVKSLYVENNAGTLSAVAVGAEPSADMTIQYQMVIVVSAETIGAVNVNDVYQTAGDELILNGGTSTSNTSNLYQDANGQSF